MSGSCHPLLLQYSIGNNFKLWSLSWYCLSLSSGIIWVVLCCTPSTVLISATYGDAKWNFHIQGGCLTWCLSNKGSSSSYNVTKVLFTIPNICLAFDTAADTCLWNFSFSSIRTPKSFSSTNIDSIVPSIVYSAFAFLEPRWITRFLI